MAYIINPWGMVTTVPDQYKDMLLAAGGYADPTQEQIAAYDAAHPAEEPSGTPQTAEEIVAAELARRQAEEAAKAQVVV